MGVGSHDLAVGRGDFRSESNDIAFIHSFERSNEMDCGVILADVGSSELSAPNGNVDLIGGKQLHVAVDTGAGIPA